MTYHVVVGEVTCDINVQAKPFVTVTFRNDADSAIAVKTSDDFQTEIPAHSFRTEKVQTHGQTLHASFFTVPMMPNVAPVDGADYTIPNVTTDCPKPETTTTTGEVTTTTSSIVVSPVVTTIPCKPQNIAEDGSCVSDGFWDTTTTAAAPTTVRPVVTHPIKQSVPTALPPTGSSSTPIAGLGLFACLLGAVAVKIGQRAWRHS